MRVVMIRVEAINANAPSIIDEHRIHISFILNNPYDMVKHGQKFLCGLFLFKRHSFIII